MDPTPRSKRALTPVALAVSAAVAIGSAGSGAAVAGSAAAGSAVAGYRAAAVSHRSSEQPPLPAVASGSQAQMQGRVVAAAPTPDGRGFWLAWSDGAVTTDGDARFHGDLSGVALAAPVVGIAATPSGQGYWLLGADGGVFGFGDAGFHGSTGGMDLAAPALQMVASPSGQGYDFVSADGGVFSFGDARFHGSTGGSRLAEPVVGMAGTPTGEGYWLVAADGGVFGFGDAGFYGSTGADHLAAPVVSMVATADGGGYWLLAADGGVFAFGDARYHGSALGDTAAGGPAVGMVATHDGGGYWIVMAGGSVMAFGDAPAMTGEGPATTGAAPAATASAAPVSGSAVGGGGFAFEVTGPSGQPVRWNPCRAVTYAVVPSGAPDGWQSDVSDDVGQVAAATGLDLEPAGTFASVSAVPASVGIVIHWASHLSGGDDVGLTEYSYVDSAGYTPEILSADVALLSGLAAGSGPGGEQPVLLHELGHAVGLAHTDGNEVMDPVDLGLPRFQPGDLAGLDRLGRAQGCAGFYR